MKKDIISEVTKAYGKDLPIYDIQIPLSVRTAETSAFGKNIYEYDPRGKAALAYASLVREVLA
jgi:chromosome partitioning protein